MHIVTINSLAFTFSMIRYATCTAVVSGLIMPLVCNTKTPAEGSIIGEYITHGKIDCAMTCRQNPECHYISVAYHEEGSLMCKLFRPYIFCTAPTILIDAWKTYELQGNCECESGWVGFNRTCYKFIPTNMTWQSARDYCNADKSLLVSITSQEENDFVAELSKSLGYGYQASWLGGHDFPVDGSWEWLSGEKFVFVNFNTDEPDGGPAESQLAMWNDGGWYDDTNPRRYTVICERACTLV